MIPAFLRLNTTYRLNQGSFSPPPPGNTESLTWLSEQEVRLLPIYVIQKSGCLFNFLNYMDHVRALNSAGISEMADYGFQFTLESRIQMTLGAFGAFIFLSLSFLVLNCHLPKTC